VEEAIEDGGGESMLALGGMKPPGGEDIVRCLGERLDRSMFGFIHRSIWVLGFSECQRKHWISWPYSSHDRSVRRMVQLKAVVTADSMT